MKLSFAVDLLNNIGGVIQHSTDHRKQGEDLVQCLKERATCEEVYARSLEKLGNTPCLQTEEGSLSQALQALRSDTLNKATQAKLLSENIMHDLVEPLKELLKEQSSPAKASIAEGRRLDKMRQTSVEKLEKAKSRYLRACQECEQSVMALESSEIRRDRTIERLVEAKREVDSGIKHYAETLDTYNTVLDTYRDSCARLLDLFQSQEEERLSSIKDVLRKLVVYETSYLRNLQYDIESLATSMESVNIQADIQNFIQENQIKLKLGKEDFVAYQGTHPSFTNLGRNSPLITIPVPVGEVIGNSENRPSVGEVYTSQINGIVGKAWSGETLDSEDYVQFNSFIKDPLGRKAVVSALNSKKNIGNAPGFDTIAELVLSLLNECQRAKDIFAIRNVTSISQSLYKNSREENLLPVIAKHSVWSNLDYWEMIIQAAIDEEIQNHKEYEENLKDWRIKNIVFVQLGSISYTMKMFNIDNMYTAEIISKYACKYDLSGEDIDTLMATIDKSLRSKREQEVVQEVQRGVPSWLLEIEGSAKPKKLNSNKLNL